MVKFIQTFIQADRKIFFLLGLLCFAAYAPMMWSPFKTLDDDFSIVKNEDIRDVRSLPEIFQKSFFKGRDYYRPLVSVSYMAEYHAFGLNYFFYNLDNVLIHTLNAFLVFLLCALLLANRPRALMVSMLFAIHPLQWEAVGNISGRAILLCATFVLAGFWLFLRFRATGAWKFLAGSAACYMLGLMSKESAGVLLFVIILYGCCVEPKERRKYIVSLWPFFLIAVLYWILRKHLGISTIYPWRTAQEYVLGFITFLGGILTYLKLLVFPQGLHFDRAMALFVSWLDRGLWITLSCWAALGVGLIAFRRAISPILFFCTGWFFIELLPVSQIVTTIGVQPGKISLAEHFVYVAVAPAMVVLVILGARIGQWLGERRLSGVFIQRAAVAGFMAFFLLTTVQQSIYASNEFLMLRHSLEMAEDNARVQYSLGLVYIKVKKIKEAIPCFRRACELEPLNARYRIAYATALADTGQLLAGVREFDKVVEPGDLKRFLERNQRLAYQKLIRRYVANIRRDKRNPEFFFALGVFYYKTHYYERALWAFDKTRDLDRNRYDAIFNLAACYEALHQNKKAVDTYKILAKSAHPGNLYRAQALNRLDQLEGQSKNPSRP